MIDGVVAMPAIYEAIYFQARGEMRAELERQVALRSGRSLRKPQSRPAPATRSPRPWARDFLVSTRPPEAEDRAVPGHWEGDLLLGARGSTAIITLVERFTRFVMLASMPDARVSEEVIDVLVDSMRRVPGQLAKADFTLAAGCQVVFCDPRSPWVSGSNESTNLLLRQYFPRTSTDFRTYTQDDLDRVARELNGRPRKTLDWSTPAEALNDLLLHRSS